MKIFYHGDMDGITAAYLYRNYRREGRYLNFIEFKYGEQEKIKDLEFSAGSNTLEIVCFFDCCPNKEILDYVITKTKKVIIIDHHISNQELLSEYISNNLVEGIFYNGASATLITYCWLKMVQEQNKSILEVIDFLDYYSLSKENQIDSDIPLAIKLINSWDIWDKLYIDAEPYKLFFDMQNFAPYDNLDKVLFDNVTVNNAVAQGNIIKQYVESWSKQFMKQFGYETRYMNYKFFVANLGCGNSKYFGDLIKEYDAVIIYCNNGTYWQCSIYSESNTFDCSEFAKQFGGGGHKKAAGFTLYTLPNWLMDRYETKLI